MAKSGILAGGVVACNEERTIADALDSLLTQDLPDGYSWGTIWVVASGCNDRTVEIVRAIADGNPLIQLIVDPLRHGKSVAIDQILQRASGSALVLLNADAQAAPGAVEALVEAARSHPAPYAVMARPVVGAHSQGVVARMTRIQWSLHHEFHRASLGSGRGNHLSDELLLLSLPGVPALPEGVINDGSYFGAWLDRHGGDRVYATEARVRIQVPRNLRDHLTQRRRILVGHAQIAPLLGRAPSTLRRLALHDPRASLAIIWKTIRDRPGNVIDLGLLLVPEIAASALSIWDRLPPRRDHVIWQQIQNPSSW